MKQISSADLYFLSKEFKILENNRIDSFYFEKDVFYIKIYVKNKGHLFLTNNIGNYIYIGEKKEGDSFPPNFIQYLRKHLKNGILTSIEPIKNERILKLKIEKKEQKSDDIKIYYLFIEVFGEGNVVVCDYNLNIINTLKKKKFKDRNVLVNEKYILPPQKEISIFNLDKSKFENLLQKQESEIVKFLAIKLGLGGKFSEEICYLTNIQKNKSTLKLDSKEIEILTEYLKKIQSIKIEAFGIYDINNNLIDFIPFDFKSIDKTKTRFDSFNDVVKNYFCKFIKEKDSKEDRLQKELKKLQNRLNSQKEQKDNVLEDYEKYNTIGNKIFENYPIIEEILNSINKSAKEKGWEHIKKVIAENTKLKKIIKKLDYKNNEIIMELE